jgi:hypothetical protein
MFVMFTVLEDVQAGVRCVCDVRRACSRSAWNGYCGSCSCVLHNHDDATSCTWLWWLWWLSSPDT